jgi:hypothetical protein
MALASSHQGNPSIVWVIARIAAGSGSAYFQYLDRELLSLKGKIFIVKCLENPTMAHLSCQPCSFVRWIHTSANRVCVAVSDGDSPVCDLIASFAVEDVGLSTWRRVRGFVGAQCGELGLKIGWECSHQLE